MLAQLQIIPPQRGHFGAQLIHFRHEPDKQRSQVRIGREVFHRAEQRAIHDSCVVLAECREGKSQGNRGSVAGTVSAVDYVEMEAGGAALACFDAPQPRPDFFMVRGVSDLADAKKDCARVKAWRCYACDVAAAFTIGLLQSGPVVFR